MANGRKMTQKEKKVRAAAKRRLQEKGLIPPDKPRLNRKKFIEEAKQEWEARESGYVWTVYLMEAISYMLGHMERNSLRYSSEAVAAAKILKPAVRLRQFHTTLVEKGEHEYSVADQYKYIKDILEA